jgi:hypothetical protein
MAIFMVKTMKRVIFQETRAYGEHSKLLFGSFAPWGLLSLEA